MSHEIMPCSSVCKAGITCIKTEFAVVLLVGYYLLQSVLRGKALS